MDTIPQPPPPDTASDLTKLTAWIDEQLADETASRQQIAETASSRIKDITLQMMGAAELGRRAAAGRQAATPGWEVTVGQALRDAIRYVREHAGFEDWQGQAGLYRAVASKLGVDLGEALTGPVGRVLSPAGLTEVLGALDHAAAFLAERADQSCCDCIRHPAGCCDSHADDLDQAARYRSVACALGDDR